MAGCCVVRGAPAPLCQAASSKARPPISAYPPPLCRSLWLTPSSHHLPQSQGECWVGDKGHSGIAGTSTAWQTPIMPAPIHSGCRGTGWRSCLSPNPFLLLYFSFFFSCLLQKGPDAFTLAGLPWPAARGGTRNAVCECVSLCVQYYTQKWKATST